MTNIATITSAQRHAVLTVAEDIAASEFIFVELSHQARLMPGSTK
jgi:hypothetical protein